MPQEFCVVKCCQCQIFQVDILKKANKWTCKLCCTRQSIMQKFGIGTSQHCREIVQRLNKKTKNCKILNQSLINVNKQNDSNYLEISVTKLKKNKWTKLADEVIERVDINNEVIQKEPNIGKQNLLNSVNFVSTKNIKTHFKFFENKINKNEVKPYKFEHMKYKPKNMSLNYYENEKIAENFNTYKKNKLFNFLDIQDIPTLDDIN